MTNMQRSRCLTCKEAPHFNTVVEPTHRIDVVVVVVGALVQRLPVLAVGKKHAVAGARVGVVVRARRRHELDVPLPHILQENAALFLSFPYVCPEPALVKCTFLV